MAKKHKTEKLTTIALDLLDNVTGGRGGGGPGHRHRAPANPWAALAPAASAEPSPLGTFANLGTRRDGQAGTAGTPGAYVHNGRFRPL